MGGVGGSDGFGDFYPEVAPLVVALVFYPIG